MVGPLVSPNGERSLPITSNCPPSTEAVIGVVDTVQPVPGFRNQSYFSVPLSLKKSTSETQNDHPCHHVCLNGCWRIGAASPHRQQRYFRKWRGSQSRAGQNDRRRHGFPDQSVVAAKSSVFSAQTWTSACRISSALTDAISRFASTARRAWVQSHRLRLLDANLAFHHAFVPICAGGCSGLTSTQPTAPHSVHLR